MTSGLYYAHFEIPKIQVEVFSFAGAYPTEYLTSAHCSSSLRADFPSQVFILGSLHSYNTTSQFWSVCVGDNMWLLYKYKCVSRCVFLILILEKRREGFVGDWRRQSIKVACPALPQVNE